jgi:uncharacterized membrane protein YgcG
MTVRTLINPVRLRLAPLMIMCCLGFSLLSGSVLAQATGTTELPVPPPEWYLQDEAHLVKEPVRGQILAACREIETALRIRIMVRTESFDSLETYAQRVETFFINWTREVDLDKRVILIFAGLGRDSLQGKVTLRAGIGLKYLLTKEMGQRILDRVILPNNAEKNDGKAFLEGILAVKGMLIDEFKREQQRQVHGTETFSIIGLFWRAKELWLVILVGLFLFYLVFFVERCPRCNGSLRVTIEGIKDAGVNTLGLRRKMFSCTRCGFSRRKKEPVYPAGRVGWWMWLTGIRRSGKTIPFPQKLPQDFAADDRHSPPE